ncbi:MAG TPA: hypothetical protein DD434_02440 [Bacteroidales bacterium]|nr:hypothetical protein [Bacteroidales bacterium]
MKETIKISLTEFMNFVNKSGSAKATVVKNAKKRRESDYEHFQDYWLPLRKKIKDVHKTMKSKDSLYELLNTIPGNQIENYKLAIDGYCKFWKKNIIEWVNPIKKTWAVGDLRIELNPELGLCINGKIYMIKLFISANENIDKRHADLILTLMEKELRNKLGCDEPTFAVLDVKKGKLFVLINRETMLYPLLKGEALSFESQWKAV